MKPAAYKAECSTATSSSLARSRSYSLVYPLGPVSGIELMGNCFATTAAEDDLTAIDTTPLVTGIRNMVILSATVALGMADRRVELSLS